MVELIDWSNGADHMWERHQVSVAEALEATGDADALWFDPDPSSKSGSSVRVIGYSVTRKAVLSIILVHRPEGGFYGANGWESNTSDQLRYERGE